MLRRKPTALTITSEDIAAFEETYLRKLAYARYVKTGEDPEGLFSRDEAASTLGYGGIGAGNAKSGPGAGAASGVIDPNDELKPLPGDKARIVRSREERIVGVGGGGGVANSGR